jgi:hypothetical protein
MLFREHKGTHYAIQVSYLTDEDAWSLELSEARATPESWTSTSHLPGATFLMALVPDEDPHREPNFHLFSPEDRPVPYKVMHWFLETVDAEVARCRAEMDRTQQGSESDH